MQRLVMSVKSLSALNQEKIQSLIIPLRHTNMILPQSAVAEIVPVPQVEERTDAAAWFIGLFGWRAQQVPLISVETLCDPDMEASYHQARRIAVLYGLEEFPGIEYFAIEIQAIPHPILLGNEDLVSIDGSSECDVISSHVQAVGIKAYLPNLSKIEHRLRDQLESL